MTYWSIYDNMAFMEQENIVKSKLAKTNFLIDAGLLKKFKFYCLERDVTMVQVIREFIEKCVNHESN